LAPDPWFESPSGWLRKPDFKRTEQKAGTFQLKRSSMLAALNMKSLFYTTFKKRWFALNIQTNIMTYYDSASKYEQSLLGAIDLSIISTVRPSIVLDAPPNSIDLVSADQVYTLVADSFELMCKWAYVINNVLTHLKDRKDIKHIVEGSFYETNKLSLYTNRADKNSGGDATAGTSDGFIRRLDFSPTELVYNIMAYADPHRVADNSNNTTTRTSVDSRNSLNTNNIYDNNPELLEFYEKVVYALIHTIPTGITAQTFCALKPSAKVFGVRPGQHSNTDLVSTFDTNEWSMMM
jgi:hypothetical protein